MRVSVPISAWFGGLVTCPEVFMHSGFLHSFWTLACFGHYRCSRIGFTSDVCLSHFLSSALSVSVSIIQFATISMVRVVMDIFINQNASKLFIDFLLCVLLKSGTRGFFVLARVCSYCAGVNINISTSRVIS